MNGKIEKDRQKCGVQSTNARDRLECFYLFYHEYTTLNTAFNALSECLVLWTYAIATNLLYIYMCFSLHSVGFVLFICSAFASVYQCDCFMSFVHQFYNSMDRYLCNTVVLSVNSVCGKY